MPTTISKTLLISSLCLLLTTTIYGADKSTYMTSDGNNSAAKVVYEYKDSSFFQVKATMGFISDIAFKSGEKITYIGGGDSKRWLIDQATVGTTPHLYIKPLAPGIESNLIVNTDRHSYHLYIVSTPNEYTPIVEFTYPEDTASSFQAMVEKPLPWKNKAEKTYFDIYTVEKDGHYIPKKLNRKYELKKHGDLDNSLLPEEIFDDGTRTYIKMPKSNKYDMPVIYNMQDNKPALVNYRIRDGYIIADRVFRKARLFYTPKTYADIEPSDSIYQGGEAK